MNATPMRFQRHRAFTLVELLTVVGIISLLMAILLPSLSRARGQAKRVKDAGIISSVGKGLEMFNNDFGQYPESLAKDDCITDYPGGTSEPEMMGAHWLARAMAGHDHLGIDTKGDSLHGIGEVKSVPPGSGNIVPDNGSSTGILMADLANKDRHGTYIEGDVFIRDTDPKFKQGAGDYEATGRPVIASADKYPILYYKANSRSRVALSVTGTGTNNPGVFGDRLGIYNQSDNGHITGGYSPDDAAEVHKGWDFAGTNRQHGLGSFGSLQNPETPPPEPFSGKNFAGYFLQASAMQLGAIRPQNPETFILISPGADGLFGTDDDVNNFK